MLKRIAVGLFIPYIIFLIFYAKRLFCVETKVLARNSWGTLWGMDDYFTIPFRYLETLAGDFWTIRK